MQDWCHLGVIFEISHWGFGTRQKTHLIGGSKGFLAANQTFGSEACMAEKFYLYPAIQALLSTSKH